MAQRAMSHAHYELRIVLPSNAPVQQALDGLRAAGYQQLPRGPAHVSLGEFSCDQELLCYKDLQYKAI